MIPLPLEFETVEIALRKRTMTGKEASGIVYATRRKMGPPWHWKTWKLARKQVLGSECATCGAGEEAILYVQHTFRNPRVRPYIERAKMNLAGKEPDYGFRPELRKEMYAIRDAVVPEMRDCCPVCNSLSIQYRKRAATWICNSKSTGKYCAHVFATPSKKPALSLKQKKAIRVEKHQAYRKKILNREHDYLREAMLAWIQDLRRYLSLRDTKTLCKRCAFLEDMTGAKPCLSCGFAYSRTKESCPDCHTTDVNVT